MHINTGAIIKKCRTDHGFTQQQFAEQLGISRSALTQMEANKTKPSYEVMERLLTEFSIDPTIFFAKDDEASLERRTMADVHRVSDFWIEQYGKDFTLIEIAEVVMHLEKLVDDESSQTALRKIHHLYYVFARLVEELDINFIDPLKRYNKSLTLLRGIPPNMRETPEFKADFKRLKKKVNVLAENVQEYWEQKGKAISKMEQPVGVDYYGNYSSVESKSNSLFKYSQEKYLRAFFFLLDHSESLKEILSFYKLENLAEKE